MSLQVHLANLIGRVAREFNEFRDLAGHNRRLAPFHMALANQDVAPCVVQVIGDSVSEGAVTGDPVHGRWVKVMERSLRDLPGGSGFLPAWFHSPFVPQVATHSHTPVQFIGATGSPPVMFDDRGAAYGFATRTLALQKLGWVEWTFFGDRARIWYAKTDFFGREGTVTIDGVAYNDVVGSNSATNDSLTYWDTPPLTRGQHTIRVAERYNLDGMLWVDGLQVFDGDYGKGVHVYETTRSGASAQFFNDSYAVWQNSLEKTDPSLVIVFLGFNDTSARTPAQFDTDMRQLVSTISGKLVAGKYTLAFVLPWATKPEPSAGWAAYWQVIETIAKEHPNGVVIRINDRWPLMTQGVENLGMFATDTVHPNESGQRMLGSYIASALDLPNKADRSAPSVGVGTKVHFEAKRSLASTSLPANGWVTYPLDSVVTNIGGGSWNPATYIYTVPEDGLYLCTASIRAADSASNRSFAMGVGTSNADAAHVFWSDLSGARAGRQYTRVAQFKAGDLVRLYIYSAGATFNTQHDANFGASGQSLSIVKIM